MSSFSGGRSQDRYGHLEGAPTQFGGGAGDPQYDDTGADVPMTVGQRARVLRMVGIADLDTTTADSPVTALSPLQEKYLTDEQKFKELGGVKRQLRERIEQMTNGYAEHATHESTRVD